MSKKIRAAVIGAGNMGKNHLRNYSKLDDFELVALVDVNPKVKYMAAEFNTKYFGDYKLMLDEMRPEVVSIVVPTPLHFEVASEVIKRGIHCLLEKPIASSVKEADRLIALARKHHVIFTVGHIERYNPLIKKLKQLVDADEIGNISSVICKRVGGAPVIEPKTDVIIDLAVHDIDIMSFLLGKQPTKIYSHGSRTHHSTKIDSAEILLDYGDASGFVQANWLTPVKIRTIAVTGSRGYVEGNYITQELVFYKHAMNGYTNKGFPDFVSRMGEPKKTVIKVDFEEPLALELITLARNIKGNSTIGLVSPIDAREALRLSLEAIEPYS